MRAWSCARGRHRPPPRPGRRRRDGGAMGRRCSIGGGGGGPAARRRARARALDIGARARSSVGRTTHAVALPALSGGSAQRWHEVLARWCDGAARVATGMRPCATSIKSVRGAVPALRQRYAAGWDPLPSAGEHRAEHHRGEGRTACLAAWDGHPPVPRGTSKRTTYGSGGDCSSSEREPRQRQATRPSRLHADPVLSQVAKVHVTEMVDPNYVAIASIDKKYLPPRKTNKPW